MKDSRETIPFLSQFDIQLSTYNILNPKTQSLYPKFTNLSSLYILSDFLNDSYLQADALKSVRWPKKGRMNPFLDFASKFSRCNLFNLAI
jgi:hypothetical protein